MLGRINKDEMRLVVDPIRTRMIGASYRKPKPEAKAGNNEPKIGK